MDGINVVGAGKGIANHVNMVSALDYASKLAR